MKTRITKKSISLCRERHYSQTWATTHLNRDELEAAQILTKLKTAKRQSRPVAAASKEAIKIATLTEQANTVLGRLESHNPKPHVVWASDKGTWVTFKQPNQLLTKSIYTH